MSIISAENLNYTIENTVILDSVSFEIKKGDYIGLLGPNGAGKTTLLKLILGFIRPTSGKLKISREIKFGYVPQKNSLSQVVPISVKEVLSMSGNSDEQKFAESLKKVGLYPEFLAKNFHNLSGGQAQRVIIARALCLDPNFLIFDEPLTGVDFETKLKIYELLSQLNKTEGLTILFVSHDIDHIVSKCHNILCLNKTIHTGCHPVDFAKGKNIPCQTLATNPQITPIHHHHNHKPKCSC